MSEEATFTYPPNEVSDYLVSSQPAVPVAEVTEAHGWDAWGSADEPPKSSNRPISSSDDDHLRQDSGFSSADHRSHGGSHAEVKVNAKASNTEPSASVASNPWAAWQASASGSSGGAEAYQNRTRMQSSASSLTSTPTSAFPHRPSNPSLSASTSRLAPASSTRLSALSVVDASSDVTVSISSSSEGEHALSPAADSDPWAAYQPCSNAAVAGQEAYERRKHLSSGAPALLDRKHSKPPSTHPQRSETKVSLSSMPDPQAGEKSSAATMVSGGNAHEADPWASYMPSGSETGSSAYERRKQLKSGSTGTSSKYSEQ